MLMVKILPTSKYGFHDSFPFDKPVPAKWFVKGVSVDIHRDYLITPEDGEWVLAEWYYFIIGADCEVVEE